MAPAKVTLVAVAIQLGRLGVVRRTGPTSRAAARIARLVFGRAAAEAGRGGFKVARGAAMDTTF